MSEPHKSPRWRKWLLIGSLALNALIIFLLVGAMLRGPDMRYRNSTPSAGLPGVMRALPKPYQHQLRDAFRDKKADHKAIRQEFAGLRRELAETLTAADFDIDKVSALMDRHRAITEQIAGNGRALLLQTISEMSAEDRAEFAENLTKKRRRKR